MKPNLRMRKILPIIIIISILSGRVPYTYVYLLPFDNIQNDPAVEWIAAGLTDMVQQELKNNYGVRMKTKDDLEVIMNDRSLMLKQPRGSRNLLILGKYNRQLDKVHVSIQVVDVATWEELAVRQIMEVYTQMASLNKAVGTAVQQMITPYLPSQPVAKISPFPAFTEPKEVKKRHPISVQSEKVASNLDQQIAELEASMDVLLGARVRNKDQPKKGIPRFVSGEWIESWKIILKMQPIP